MVHTAVVLPPDLIAQLKADAKKTGQGMSAEIRERLRATYLMQLSRGDLETGKLLNAVKHLSDFLARDLGKRWHEHPYAMAAFKAGVAALLARYQPQAMKDRVQILKSLAIRPMWLAALMHGSSELRATKRKMSERSRPTIH